MARARDKSVSKRRAPEKSEWKKASGRSSRAWQREPKGPGQSLWSWGQWRELTVRMDHASQTESCPMADSDAQTSQTGTKDSNMQASLVPTTPTTPMVCCLPVEYRVASKAMAVSSEVLKDNDEITKFYTGVLLWKVFHHLVCSLSTCCPDLTSSRTKKVSPSNGLLLTLMRLRVNLWMKYLLYHFSILISIITNVFQKFITTIHVHLKFLIEWSTHGTCYKHVSDI